MFNRLPPKGRQVLTILALALGILIAGGLSVLIVMSIDQSRTASISARSTAKAAALQTFSVEQLKQPATPVITPYVSRTPAIAANAPVPTLPSPTAFPSLTPSPFVTMFPPQQMTDIRVFVITALHITKVAQITQSYQATQIALSAPCPCVADTLDCTTADFPSVKAAQACYDYCVAVGAGDIHGLDYYYDGLACEDGLY
jgi:hypothetical protein